VISLPNTFKAFSWRIAVVSAILAVPSVVSSVWAWNQIQAVPAGYRDGASFQVISGRGSPVTGGLQVTEVGADGRAIVATELPDLIAKQYESVRFEIEGLDSASGAGIYFTAKSQPTVGHPRALTLQMARDGVVRISEDPRWDGEVQTIGFIIQGPLQRAITVRGITLVPAEIPSVNPTLWVVLGVVYMFLAYIALATFLGNSSGAKGGHSQHDKADR
jgi:hypothetical protein